VENLQNAIRNTDVLKGLSRRLASLRPAGHITIMEVCGTHTMAIHRAGIPSLLPDGLTLLSGPGCPVCVTPVSYIETALAMAREHDVVLATFGDMVRVPGDSGSLSSLRSDGYGVEIVYSPIGALELARNNPDRNVVFLAVGFETTAPAVAASVLEAAEEKIDNFTILSAHKLIMPALELLVSDESSLIDGFILPGHVSVVLGSEPYRKIAEEFSRACVITGFETADIIQGILMLVEQVEKKDYRVEIQYRRVVKPGGNPHARAFIERVFEPIDTEWRGFGSIPGSGLGLRDEFSEFDAGRRFPVAVEEPARDTGCRCGEVLMGRITPRECPLFGAACIPLHPVGPCMVSGEGTCAAYYKYSQT